jgi:hypothetical protein
MQITSSIVFFLLGRKFKLEYPREDFGAVALTEPRILESPELEPGIFYIVDNPELLSRVEQPAACAFLLCGRAKEQFNIADEKNALWFRGSDVAALGDEVSPANLIKASFSLFLALQDWDNRLKDASAETTGDYERIFKLAGEFFDLPFVLIDCNFFVFAYTPNYFHGREENMRERNSLEAVNKMLAANDERFHFSDHLDPYLYPVETPRENSPPRYLCCNIFRGSHFEGRIVASLDREKNHSGRSQLLKHLCIYIGKAFITSTDDMLAKRQDDPLHLLVKNSIFSAEGVPERDASAALGNLAWQINDPYLLVTFQIADERSFTHGALYICRRLETDALHSCAITYASQIIWLIDTKDIAQKNIKRDYQQIIAFIVQEYNCKAGVSKPFDNFMDLRNSYTQAVSALRLGYKRDPQLWVYRFPDYVLDYMLERTESELPLEDLLHPAALTLWSLDKNTGTDYIKTLRYYMDFQYNMTAAAEKLSVHRTTLIRRLDRIIEITGLDYEKPREMLQVAISLYLLTPAEPQR